MTKTFTDILSRPVQSIEKPKPRPLGTYYAVVQGLPKQREITGKDGSQSLILDYLFKLTSVKSLEDPDNADAASTVTDWAPLTKGFFVNSEESEWAHRQFLVNTLGIEPGDKTIGQMMAESPGRQVLVTTKHRPYTDANGEAGIATDIASVAKV